MRKLGKIFLVCMTICALFTGCESEGAKKVGSVQDSSSETASAEKDSTKKEETSDKKSDSKEKEEDSDEENGIYHPGDIVSFGDFKITYKSVGKYKSKNEFIQPEDGYQYIKFSFAFENKGKEDSYIGSFDCYADGEKCEEEYIGEDAGDFLLTKLSAGRKTSGNLFYQVPKGTKLKDIELEYESNSFLSDEKIIFSAK